MLNRTLIVPAFICALSACDRAPEAQERPTHSAKPAALQLTGLKKLALESIGGTGRIDKKIAKLQALAKDNAKKFETWILLGRAWVQKARQTTEPAFYNNANACADIAMELKPQNPLALNLKGMVLMNDHRFEEARDLMQKILERDGDDIMALGILSDALLELGEFDKAATATQKMVDLKPSLPSYARASYLRWLQGDIKSATAAIRQAIDAGGSPSDREPLAWVLVEAAKIFWHQGDYEGADAGFKQALIVFPDYPPALAWMARSKLSQGKPAEAAKLAKKSYAESALAETAMIWGDAARAAGMSDESSLAYEKLTRLGKQGEHRVLAAHYAAENKNIDEAIALAKKELKGRGDIYSYDALAWALYRKGDIQSAQKEIERATKFGTKDAQLLFHKGAIMIAAGDKAGQALIKEALSLNPNFDPKAVLEAKALLK